MHCTRAVQAGATLAEVEHVVLMMLGTSLGLAPTVDALRWAHEELGEARSETVRRAPRVWAGGCDTDRGGLGELNRSSQHLF